MSETELVQIMYEKHRKMLLNMEEACGEWGMSYSAATKFFGGQDALSEKIILGKKIMPKWTKVGSRRMWKLTDIAKWVLEVECEK